MKDHASHRPFGRLCTLAATTTVVLAVGFAATACASSTLSSPTGVPEPSLRGAEMPVFDEVRNLNAAVAGSAGGSLGEYQLAVGTDSGYQPEIRLAQYLVVNGSSDLTIDSVIIRGPNSAQQTLTDARKSCRGGCHQISTTPGTGKWTEEGGGQRELVLVRGSGPDVAVRVSIKGPTTAFQDVDIPVDALSIG